MSPPCTRMYTHPFFEATPPGAAPGPPVNTGARVRHIRQCKKLHNKAVFQCHCHVKRCSIFPLFGESPISRAKRDSKSFYRGLFYFRNDFEQVISKSRWGKPRAPAIPRNRIALITPPEVANTGTRFLTGGPGAAPGGVASKNGCVNMRVRGESISYSLASLSVCRSVGLSVCCY